MNSIIYNPLQDYTNTLKQSHAQKTEAYLETLVEQSGIHIEQNRQTVREHAACLESLAKIKKKLNWRRFWRVLMILTVVLIPLVLWKISPKIKALKKALADGEQKAAELLAEAKRQTDPLNALFSDGDALRIIEQAMPLVSFAPHFSKKQEADMALNYDFARPDEAEESVKDTLAGSYHENPFVFESRLVHKMGSEVYHGYKTIHWTETYRDSDGRLRTRTRSETLHACVTKPKPFYHTQIALHYGAQGAPELCFSRDASHLDQKSDRELERYVKRGEKMLKKKTDEAIKNNDDFMSMSNTDFEVLFDALDRTSEVQFRTLFTPLAQTNMVELIRSQEGFGDDFNFIKKNRSNTIITKHSQERELYLSAKSYQSYDFDVIKQRFLSLNEAFFKAVYFDLAPILAIPVYQEKPTHSLKPLPKTKQSVATAQCEALANAVDAGLVVHPQTKTQAILKACFKGVLDEADAFCLTAHSYGIRNQVDFVPVWGGDGRVHSVAVPWDEYFPLEISTDVLVKAADKAPDHGVLAVRHGLCIFKK